MTEQMYENLTRPFRESKYLLFILKALNFLTTLVGYIAYPTLLYFLMLWKDIRLIPYILIPGISFVFFSIVRNKLNKPRPYEVLNIKPLIKKDKKGSSFPSRHIFSIFLIATIWFPINLQMGCTLLSCGSVLVYTRVVGGIHFPKDVIVGAIIGILCGIITIII